MIVEVCGGSGQLVALSPSSCQVNCRAVGVQVTLRVTGSPSPGSLGDAVAVQPCLTQVSVRSPAMPDNVKSRQPGSVMVMVAAFAVVAGTSESGPTRVAASSRTREPWRMGESRESRVGESRGGEKQGGENRVESINIIDDGGDRRRK